MSHLGRPAGRLAGLAGLTWPAGSLQGACREQQSTEVEKAEWHPDVDVQFNLKAWATADYLVVFAERELARYGPIKESVADSKVNVLF